MITANTWFEMTFPMFHKRRIMTAQIKFGIQPQGIDVTEYPLVEAHVNRGAWIVKCPAPDCRGVELAWEEGLYYCFSCHNAYMGHRIRRCSFPMQRKEIERILEQRPLPNRNWIQDETVNDLEMENIEHCHELLSVRKED